MAVQPENGAPTKLNLVALPGHHLRGVGTVARRRVPSVAATARRSFMIGFAKRVLPVVALVLLTVVALWPEISNDPTRPRLALNRNLMEPQSGEVTKARYNGVDENGSPYTVTATTAHQVSADRINLVAPVGDVKLGSGSWMQAQGKQGVYVQALGQLDMSGDVTVYRDDGVTLQSDSATLDLHGGSASSADRVHAEGPFGTLDAQGFSFLDRGTIIQFHGPGRMVLNGLNR